ncbi:MAG: glycosyltransferase family 2 protein [Planctomycetes bacterium]|nr:glycosyltransferase family 2 protein [Planctomycetota bacterium]
MSTLAEPIQRSAPLARCRRNARILVVVCAYNEASKLGHVFDRLSDCIDGGTELLLVDDASTDGTTALIEKRGCRTIRHRRRRGAGACVRTAIRYALDHDYDILVFMAGNDKDRPEEIPRLLEPILQGEADLVQGSRYLPDARWENTPFYRRIATQFIHPTLFSWFTGKKMTDTTNGFRAIRREVLEDPRIDLQQDWLDRYELEPYLLFKTVRLGYRVCEVPVSKVYPAKRMVYTKMRPLTGWWSIIRPIFLLGLGLRK